MNREKFLAKATESAVKLTAVPIPGWDEPVYIRPMTIAEVKETILRPDQPDDARSRLAADPYMVERTIARVARDEHGALIFDADDDSQMEELRDAIQLTPPGLISGRLQQAQAALNVPDKEVDAKGN